MRRVGRHIGQAFQPDSIRSDRFRPDPRQAGKPDLRRAGLLLLLPLLILAVARAGGDPTAAVPAARMTVSGRVLDPQGTPVPRAAVMVIVRSKLSDRPTHVQTFGPLAAHDGRCDGSGRFRIELPRTSSARDVALAVMALAPGYGVGWADLDPDADPPVADVALRPEQVIRGRLFDVQGRPAPGVAIYVYSVDRARHAATSTPIYRPDMYQRPSATGWPGPVRRSATTRGASSSAGWAGA